ncbi:hypothetical protein JVU11DRAFT_10535 [Chiua virens]|nr:hypothetical protein JVU11DRAFT_10535 [Chiua virens]
MYQIICGIKQLAKVSGPPPSSVTFRPSPHIKAESVGMGVGLDAGAGVDSSLAFLRAVTAEQGNICAELLHSSLPTSPDAFRDIMPRRNGFVNTVVEAYSKHHALVIRPDDVWLAILTQFSFFVNGNAEALRKVFVAHEGKRELVVVAPIGNRYTMKPDLLALQMTELMPKHIVDKSLREWMMPSFTTTTATDTATSAIVMMGSMKEYFEYTFLVGCGLPKVTLEGEKKDWEDILRRLERLKEYGVQTIAWYHLLRPIISRFIAAYDAPTSKKNLDFWNKVAHSTGGEEVYSPLYLSGWITAFCVFDQLGQWQGNTINASAKSLGNPQHLSASRFAATHLLPATRDTLPYLKLDGFPYPKITHTLIPYGYTYVDVKLDDNGKTFDTTFVAGSIGSHISSTMGAWDTLRPIPGWWYFIKGTMPQKLKNGWGEVFQDAMWRREAATAATQIPSRKVSKRVSRVKPVSAEASTGKIWRDSP